MCVWWIYVGGKPRNRLGVMICKNHPWLDLNLSQFLCLLQASNASSWALITCCMCVWSVSSSITDGLIWIVFTFLRLKLLYSTKSKDFLRAFKELFKLQDISIFQTTVFFQLCGDCLWKTLFCFDMTRPPKHKARSIMKMVFPVWWGTAPMGWRQASRHRCWTSLILLWLNGSKVLQPKSWGKPETRREEAVIAAD